MADGIKLRTSRWEMILEYPGWFNVITRVLTKVRGDVMTEAEAREIEREVGRCYAADFEEGGRAYRLGNAGGH